MTHSSKLVLRTPTLKLFALGCALLWMTGLLTCAVWVGHSFTKESFKYLWPITVRTLKREPVLWSGACDGGDVCVCVCVCVCVVRACTDLRSHR